MQAICGVFILNIFDPVYYTVYQKIPLQNRKHLDAYQSINVGYFVCIKTDSYTNVTRSSKKVSGQYIDGSAVLLQIL